MPLLARSVGSKGALEVVSQSKCFGGTVTRYQHWSESTQTKMGFSVFAPPGEHARMPVLYFLSGLTCDDTNFTIKAGALQHLARRGMLLVCPDTSPRGLSLPGETDHWDFGRAAGFYLDATTPGYRDHYRMYTYVTQELPKVAEESIRADPDRRGIFGHSMGGLGALNLFLHNRSLYKSVSAFSPICNPTQCPWGRKAFIGFLGPDEEQWKPWDPSVQLKALPPKDMPSILISQGTADQFLKAQLQPEALPRHPAVRIELHDGYDHGYYFVSTFIEQHIDFHAENLRA